MRMWHALDAYNVYVFNNVIMFVLQKVCNPDISPATGVIIVTVLERMVTSGKCSKTNKPDLQQEQLIFKLLFLVLSHKPTFSIP